MFDKHLSVDMLDYPKLFEEETPGITEENESQLSSIREERESKEDYLNSKKGTNISPKEKK